MERRILRVLETAVSPPVARAVLRTACELNGIDLERLTPATLEKLGTVFVPALTRFGVEKLAAMRCARRIVVLASSGGGPSSLPPAGGASATETVIPISEEYDVVRVRGEGKAMSARLGFSALFQVKIATAISELARNIVLYAGRGVVTLRVLGTPKVGIEIVAEDQGPGIRDIEGVLSGNYRSRRGLGAGLRGTKNLMDHFEIDTGRGGTCVTIRKFMA